MATLHWLQVKRLQNLWRCRNHKNVTAYQVANTQSVDATVSAGAISELKTGGVDNTEAGNAKLVKMTYTDSNGKKSKAVTPLKLVMTTMQLIMKALAKP